MQCPGNPSGNQKSDEEQTVRGCFCETSCQLNQELEETKAQLKRQKSLKEKIINKEKETRQELERLKKYTNPETLSTAKIANQVSDNTKRKKKKLLQVDYEELQVAHIINEEKFQAEQNKNKLLQEELERLNISYQVLNARYENDVPKLKKQAFYLQCDLDNEILQKHLEQSDYEEAFKALQEEREKNKTLQEQLEKASVSLHEVKQQADTLRFDLEKELEQKKLLQTSYEELQETHKLSQDKFSAEIEAEREKSMILKKELDKMHETTQKYEAEVTTVREQAETLQRELETEVKSHAVSVSEGFRMIQNVRAEQEAIRQQMAEEITVLQQNARESEKIFGSELDNLKTQLSVQISLNLELSTELQAEREALQKITDSNDNQPPKKAEAGEDKQCEQQETISPALALEPPKQAEDKQCEQQATISPALALESQRGAQGNLPDRTAEPPSVGRDPSLLGLRKPARWKRRREN
ncbi:kinesin-like protein KIF15 [Larimichthys crocea]|uniref:kinesin-like protein KIF15 n=1 Tax=Larimichthys crocea TaxID=215358 RepID=UPI000F5F221E|nr:kinesin-like protein KIF15 [Larimichthys crocea]